MDSISDHLEHLLRRLVHLDHPSIVRLKMVSTPRVDISDRCHRRRSNLERSRNEASSLVPSVRHSCKLEQAEPRPLSILATNISRIPEVH